ncbi:hypothetical protein ZHAS_00016324 [Anopheles sinensis]|uniref:Uncharacterized protein n=1 Tax=Anopheles sinensis TaxID=74873 RepID=A0A084WDP6_ANOSI|nr:hypothetical protein ZHAS_00016324 [Anopheles sinensis]
MQPFWPRLNVVFREMYQKCLMDSMPCKKSSPGWFFFNIPIMEDFVLELSFIRNMSSLQGFA